eukprot:2610887-Rhodomonas_salina.1
MPQFGTASSRHARENESQKVVEGSLRGRVVLTREGGRASKRVEAVLEEESHRLGLRERERVEKGGRE